MEQSNLHQLGAGGNATQKSEAAVKLVTTPLSVFYCPSRRSTRLYPHRSDTTGQSNRPLNPGIDGQRVAFDNMRQVAKTCYTMNGGVSFQGFHAGPATIAAAATHTFPSTANDNGICTFRSEIASVDVRDGTSNTYAVGEKFLNPDDYAGEGIASGEAQCMYIGYDHETSRWGSAVLAPLRDQAGVSSAVAYGSAHGGGFNVALCDGSVRTISFSLNGTVHERLANRKDYQPVDMANL